MKSRICARPFNKASKSKDHLFAPTPLSSTMKLLLVLAQILNYAVKFFDISRAFLHTPIREDVCLQPPPDYFAYCLEVYGVDPGDIVWQLRCTIYGLKEAMVDFDQHFEEANVQHMGMRRLVSDPAVYANDQTGVIMSKHVDDGLMIGSETAVEEYEAKLSEHFMLKSSEFMAVDAEHVYLGKVIRRIEGGFAVRCGDKLVENFLESLELADCKSVPTPGLPVDCRVPGEEPLGPVEARKLRGSLGQLMYIAHERCDVQYPAKEIARGAAKLTTQDLVRIKRVARYLAGTRKMENILRPYQTRILDLRPRVDSDWAKDKVDRRSTSSGHIMLNGAMLNGYSRTQATRAQSSGEAELYAMGTGTCEGLLIQSMIRELPIGMEVEMTVESDSSAAISSQLRGGMGRMKHVELRHMFMQQLVKEKRISMQKIPGEENSSDLGTKYLDRPTFEKHRRAAGLRNRGGDDEQGGQVNAIEPGSSTNNGVVMTLTGMARCFAGILALMQVKSAGAESEKAYQVYDNSGMDSFMFLMHVLLLAAAFACGYRLGKTGAAQPPLAVRGINQGTNTYEEGINVSLHDLTVEALRSRLRALHCSPSGTKLELEARLEAAMHALQLRIVIPR